MVPPSARFPTRRAALAEEAARRALAGLGPELVLPQLRAQTVQELLAQLLRQYMHNTEIAVTMRLSTILKTIKQPL